MIGMEGLNLELDCVTALAGLRAVPSPPSKGQEDSLRMMQ